MYNVKFYLNQFDGCIGSRSSIKLFDHKCAMENGEWKMENKLNYYFHRP